MRILLAPLALVLLSSSPAFAQKKAKAPAKTGLAVPAPLAATPAAKVTVASVHDRRSDTSVFKKLEIELELPDVPGADVTATRTFVTAAVDDTGRNLVPEDAARGVSAMPMGRMPRSEEKPAPARVTVELRNPARKATAVSSVAGEIELFMPGRDPNGTATLPKFLSQPGRPLADPALKANGVEVMVLGKEQLEAEKRRQIDKLRADAKKQKISGERLEAMVEDLSYGFPKPEEGEVVLRVKAPEGRIQEIVCLDPAGEEKRVSTSEKQGFILLSTWGDKPAPDWSLRIRMKTPKTLARFAYALKDVPLP